MKKEESANKEVTKRPDITVEPYSGKTNGYISVGEHINDFIV